MLSGTCTFWIAMTLYQNISSITKQKFVYIWCHFYTFTIYRNVNITEEWWTNKPEVLIYNCLLYIHTYGSKVQEEISMLIFVF